MVYRNRKNQQYEEYWKVTLEITDFERNDKFYKAIKIIKKAIDNGFVYKRGGKDYSDLQEKIIRECGQTWKGKKDRAANARKLINQTVKLGIFTHKLESYPQELEDLLKANKEDKKTILSRIILEHNKLNGSVSVKDNSKTNRIKFLISTIEENKLVTKENLAGIMNCNPDNYPAGYLNSEELSELTNRIINIDWISRKYNPLSHFTSVLKYGFSNYFIYSNVQKGFVLREELDFKEKIREGEVFGTKPKRSRVDQANYRDLLIIEIEKYHGKNKNNTRAKDMVQDKEFSKRKMIASHIFPYSICHKRAEYDPNNGLLLGEDLDYWFDNGSISIDDEGKLLFKDNVDSTWVEDLKNKTIDSHFLNDERKKYLRIHRIINGFEKSTDEENLELLLSFNNIELNEVDNIRNSFQR